MTKVAIIRRGGLGDLLCTFPLILYFKKYHPDAKITLFVDQRNAPLLSYLPRVDQVIVLPCRGSRTWNLLKTALKYRSQKFDIALSGKTSPMKLMNLFLYALGAKKRIAYIDPGVWHSTLVNGPLNFDKGSKALTHQALKALRLVAPQHSEVPPSLYPRIEIPLSTQYRYQSLIALDEPTLLISASNIREKSTIATAKYATLCNTFCSEHPCRIVLIAQSGDKRRAERIASLLRVPYLVHIPRSFEEFMAIMDLSDLYFIGDGGNMHIGAALDKPQVVLFGDTNPSEWSPLSTKARTLFHQEHVNAIEEALILEALSQTYREVIRGREDQANRDRADQSESFPAEKALF